MYYALIADIVNSKKISQSERNAVQQKLEGVLGYVNQKYKSLIVSNFCITIGDEFQGILSVCKNLLEIITYIELSMLPVKLRFAVGYGAIETAINPLLPMGSDGPAWWKARSNMQVLKQKFGRGLKQQSNIIVSGKENKEITELINITLTLCCLIKSKWKDEHISIIKYIIDSYGLKSDIVQKKAADALNIMLYDLNKKLKTSRYFDYAMAMEKITAVMED